MSGPTPGSKVFHCQPAAYYKLLLLGQSEVLPNQTALFYRTGLAWDWGGAVKPDNDYLVQWPIRSICDFNDCVWMLFTSYIIVYIYWL